MSVQIRNQTPVRRPLGQVTPEPADGGKVELRLHGVGGTPPEDLLGDLSPQLVAGDRIAGFYRTADQPVPATVGAADPPAGAPESTRHIEAYSWGGLTSRSAARVLWVLLLPFALANAAGWMCTADVLKSGPRFYLHRFAVRFGGLAMTLNVVVLLLMTGEDLIGTQCPNSLQCRAKLAPAGVLHKYWFADHPGRAMAVGALLPVVALLIFYGLGRFTIGRYETVRAPAPDKSADLQAERSATLAPDRGKTAARHDTGLADPDFWHGYGAARRLSAVHLAAGLATVAGVLAWTSHRTLVAHSGVANQVIVWVSAGVCVLAVVSLGWHTTAKVWTRLLLGLSAVVMVGAVVDAWLIGETTAVPTVVAGMRWVANGTFGLVILAIVLTVVAVLCGGGRVAGSFLVPGPAVILAFAFALVNAIGILIIMRLGSWIGFPALGTSRGASDRDLQMYTFIDSAAIWCVSSSIVTVLGFAVVTWRRMGRRKRLNHDSVLDQYPVKTFPETPEDSWRKRPLPAAGRDEPANPPLTPDDRAWLASIDGARFLAKLPRRGDLLILLIVLANVATLAVVEYLDRVAHRSVQPPSLVATVASFAAAASPVAFVALMRWGWRSTTARRQIGIVWDVVTFWPRAYHPFAPPCYAERAVPELQWRLWYLQDQQAEIVLAAHSQGSVVATAALLQQEHRKPGSDVGLLTFGCPLDTLYKWAFPAYFNDDVFEWIMTPPADGQADAAKVSVWHNRYCQTDYIGNTDVKGADNLVIPDPPDPYYVVGSGQRPAIGAHTGYWTDPALWADIESLHRPV